MTLSTVLVATAMACAGPLRHAPGGSCAPRPGEIYGATADSLLGGAVVSWSPGITHTERMMDRDPVSRTHNHFHGLRYDLRVFVGRNSRFPDSIEEFHDTAAPGIKYHIDGWGSSIRYTRLGADSFEFRAPGPDHTLCTADDVIVRGDDLEEVPAP